MRETGTRGSKGGRFQGITWFREIDTGDYIAVYGRPLLGLGGRDRYEARVVAIANLPSSACSSAVAADFLRDKCKRVALKDVPLNWQNWLIPEDTDDED